MPAVARTALSNEVLHRLLSFGRALVSERNDEMVLHRALEVARELTGARYAAIGVIAPEGEKLERFITSGIDEEAQRRIGPPPHGRGVLGVLIRDPRTLRLPDVGHHPESYGFPEGHPPMTTFLGVPIVIRDHVFGNLYLTEKAGGAEFTDVDAEAAEILADWAALAIDNARSYSDEHGRRTNLERAVASLQATNDITRAIGGETDLDRVLELIVKRARALVKAQTVLILQREEGRDHLSVVAMAGEGDRDLLEAAIPASSLPVAAGAGGDPYRLGELAQLENALAEHLDPSSGLLMPLRYRGQDLGLLCAFDRIDAADFDEEDELLVGSFAASAALSLATARRVSEQGLRRSIQASELERTRWARELHDETLQELAGLKVLLAGSRTDPTGVDRAVEQIEMSITGLRRLITELRPATLDEYGLAAAIEGLVDRIRSTSGIEVSADVALAYEAGLEESRHTPELESTLYRLVQEATTNAVKHAEPDRIWVSIQEGESDVVVEVRDDGRGFDPETGSDGFGLVGMRERVELAGGQLELASAPGRGTTVRTRLPVRRRDRR